MVGVFIFLLGKYYYLSYSRYLLRLHFDVNKATAKLPLKNKADSIFSGSISMFKLSSHVSAFKII